MSSVFFFIRRRKTSKKEHSNAVPLCGLGIRSSNLLHWRRWQIKLLDKSPSLSTRGWSRRARAGLITGPRTVLNLTFSSHTVRTMKWNWNKTRFKTELFCFDQNETLRSCFISLYGQLKIRILRAYYVVIFLFTYLMSGAALNSTHSLTRLLIAPFITSANESQR